jgi:hypothetical protein
VYSIKLKPQQWKAEEICFLLRYGTLGLLHDLYNIPSILEVLPLAQAFYFKLNYNSSI